MFCQNEFELLRLTLKKHHVRTATVSPAELAATVGEEEPLPVPVPRTLYRFRDALGLCYLYLVPDTTAPGEILLIGPYFKSPPTEEVMVALAERRGLPQKGLRYLREYCAGIAVLDGESPLLLLLESFCERLFDTPSFATADVSTGAVASPFFSVRDRGDAAEEILVGMRTMERRYEFENELMDAVSHGQLHREEALLSSLRASVFEQRLPDTLRNAKNYGVIMNTLLRKAAERGGVHPFYLDRVSSDFAAKIEAMRTVADSAPLMHEMFRTYCRLVHQHVGRSYSPIVRKTVLLIDSHLTEGITPRALAAAQGVSLGYLSTVFRRETGMTLSAYAQEQRVKHAAYLLTSTDLQVQAVALQCGIVDAPYFTKLFKKVTGKTPNQFRREAAGGKA